MKLGIIITLYKGGDKRKNDPDSYRAITLTSCVLKLFEQTLLNRIVSTQKPFYPLQEQKYLGLGFILFCSVCVCFIVVFFVTFLHISIIQYQVKSGKLF